MLNRTYFQETFYDMSVDVAQRYADIIRDAIVNGKSFDGEKQQGYFLSKNRGFDDKLYVGNIHRIENRLYWRDEELQDDDEIINVVMIDGPVTRDGDGCSYGSKDHRDQILYANTIPQVKGHIFIINTPGGAASARIDYEQAINDCREKGKPTVAWVDGLCCSAGQLVASLCDRTIVMNGRHTMGCIGTMCAFWGVPNGTVDSDGYRYIELVSVTSPDKNAEYREACDGKTEKLQAELDKLGEEFRETVRQNRPLVKDEHLTGMTFDAQDVMGALVDEIGDYTRAIEAVFELAGGTLPAARTVVDDEGQESSEDSESPEENAEMAKLNDQQKSAIAANAGEELTIDNGKVKKSVDGMFGPETHEIANPKNNSNMTQEEKMAAKAEAAKAAEKNDEAAQAEGQEAGVQATQEGAGEGAQEGAGEGSGEGAGEGAQEGTQEGAGEGTGEGEGEGAGEGDGSGDGASDGEGSGEGEGSGDGAGDGAHSAQPSDKTIEEAQAEIEKITETLHNAEALVEEKDKTIAGLKEALEANNTTIADRDKTIEELRGDMEVLRKGTEEKDAIVAARDKTIKDLQTTIENQKKLLAEKEAEIKELAGTTAPMTDGSAGVPADNGTGDAPKSNGIKSVIKPGMSLDEMKAAIREKDEKRKTYRH